MGLPLGFAGNFPQHRPGETPEPSARLVDRHDQVPGGVGPKFQLARLAAAKAELGCGKLRAKAHVVKVLYLAGGSLVSNVPERIIQVRVGRWYTSSDWLFHPV